MTALFFLEDIGEDTVTVEIYLSGYRIGQIATSMENWSLIKPIVTNNNVYVDNELSIYVIQLNRERKEIPA